MVRYADDFVILCRTAEEAQQALALVQRWTVAAGLRLHPTKTHLVDMQQPGGFDFLGYHFERDHRWPRQKSLRRLKDAGRQHTRRTNGQSRACLIAAVDRTLRGWFEYFKHRHGTFGRSTRGSERGCGIFCGSVVTCAGVPTVRTIGAGPIPSSRRRACSP
jgi:RNA-directed DNA polymerase